MQDTLAVIKHAFCCLWKWTSTVYRWMECDIISAFTAQRNSKSPVIWFDIYEYIRMRNLINVLIVSVHLLLRALWQHISRRIQATKILNVMYVRSCFQPKAVLKCIFAFTLVSAVPSQFWMWILWLGEWTLWLCEIFIFIVMCCNKNYCRLN